MSQNKVKRTRVIKWFNIEHAMRSTIKNLPPIQQPIQRAWKTIVTPLIFILWLPCSLAFALDSDRIAPIHIESDKIDLKAIDHQIVYLGHVEVSQGSTHLVADKAITIGDNNNQLTHAIVYGNKEQVAHAWAQMEANKPPVHIWADIIHYYPKKRLVTLIGHARVVQGDNHISAPKIHYNLEKKQVTTESIGPQRTLIVIHPEKSS